MQVLVLCCSYMHLGVDVELARLKISSVRLGSLHIRAKHLARLGSIIILSYIVRLESQEYRKIQTLSPLNLEYFVAK